MHAKISVEDAEKRDPKGLYKMARAGKLKDFTGIDSPYEEPLNPDLVISTAETPVEECVEKIIALLKERNLWQL